MARGKSGGGVLGYGKQACHAFAFKTLVHGADLYMVGKVLGNSNNIAMTIYAKVVDDMKKAVTGLPRL